MTSSVLAAPDLSSRPATAVARGMRLAADTGIAEDRVRDAPNRTFEKARREGASFIQTLELGNPSHGARIVDGTGAFAGGGEHTGRDPLVIGMRGLCGVRPLLGSVAQALMGSRDIDIPAAPPGQ